MNLVTPKALALSMRFCSTNRPLDIEVNVLGRLSLPRQIIQLEQAHILINYRFDEFSAKIMNDHRFYECSMNVKLYISL